MTSPTTARLPSRLCDGPSALRATSVQCRNRAPLIDCASTQAMTRRSGGRRRLVGSGAKGVDAAGRKGGGQVSGVDSEPPAVEACSCAQQQTAITNTRPPPPRLRSMRRSAFATAGRASSESPRGLGSPGQGTSHPCSPVHVCAGPGREPYWPHGTGRAPRRASADRALRPRLAGAVHVREGALGGRDRSVGDGRHPPRRQYGGSRTRCQAGDRRLGGGRGSAFLSSLLSPAREARLSLCPVPK